MLIIQTGNIEKSTDILTFKDSMLEKDISKETEKNSYRFGCLQSR